MPVSTKDRAIRLGLQCAGQLGLSQRLPAEQRVGLDALERDWSFVATRPAPVEQLRRNLARRRRWPAPDHLAIKPIAAPRARWIAYFIYLPQGRQLDAGHRYTIARLRESDAGLLIVCATPEPTAIPEELRAAADALIWKALDGFDFSGYALALSEIARASSGADVLVLNDSTYGPFAPVDALWPQMRWDLTGFTASAAIQNHVQSYAFFVRDLSPARLAVVAEVLHPDWAFNDYSAAVLCQETRLATLAARHMRVGAFWYANGGLVADPSLFAALPLVDAGFPFLKRALLGKHSRIYPADAIRSALQSLGHPVD